jgi:signal transduction histidine kinase
MTRPSWWAGPLSTVVLPLAVAAGTLAATVPTRGFFQPDARPFDAAGIALLLAGPALLVVLRWHPPVVLAGAAAAVLSYFVAGYPFGPGAFLAVLVALAAAVAGGYRLAAYSVAAVTYTSLVVLHGLRNPGVGLLIGALAWLAWLAVVATASELWRSHRTRLAQDAAIREGAERRRAGEERLRLARELHDVLGHHVSLINVQAGVALYLMDDDPEQARQALVAIKGASRELLREMRSTLGVLRGVDEDPPRHPAAGLGRLTELVADSITAGLPVEVHVHGERRPLPAGVDLAAYRIVQEALTNTRRHAHADQAVVSLHFDDDGLTIEIDDDGRADPAGPPPAAGNGLSGMRERATALGGSLTAGARPDGGFRVRGHLPAGPAPAEPHAAS